MRYSRCFTSLSWWAFTLLSFNFLQGAQGRPRNHGQQSGVEFRSERNHSAPTTGVRNNTEKPQRLCLARLRDALQLACGGSERVPAYFDPTQFLNLTQGTKRIESSLNPNSKNLRNDISTMSRPNLQRRLMRRRSRRNIVRECCHKACSPANLMKYCSTSIRFSSTFRGESSGISTNRKQFLGEFKRKDSVIQSKLPFVQDDSQHVSTHDALLNNNNHTNHSNDIKMNSLLVNNLNNRPSDSQCLTIADLQKFYEKIALHGIWKKDAVASWDYGNSHNQRLPEFSDSQRQPDDDGNGNFHAINAYAVATNEMRPNLKDILNQMILLNQENYPVNSQSPSTTTEKVSTTDEIFDDNESDNNVLEFEEVIDSESSTKTQTRYTPNIQTVKPVIFISLPKGTNDYYY